MGLEDADLVDDGYVGGKAAVSVSCSICLEVVTDNGDRSWAKLQCGHEFHLDCIGSAFNVKGVMQCPNCRKIEKGQWLYANGCKPYPEFSVEEWDHDVDLYDLSYPETSMWCPFGGFTRLTASFDDGEFPTNAYHDVVGPHAILTEHASATHLCPYITYVHPSSSSSTSTSTATANVGDGPTNQWNNSSQSDQMPNSYAMNVRYHTLFPTQTNHADPPRRPLRNGSYVHPFLVAQSSGGRAPGSSMMHPYPGSAARARERSQALQAYFQQPTGLRAPPMVSGSRRSTGQAQPQMGPSSDQIRGIYYLPTSTGRSGPAFQEPETSIPNPNPWERDSHPGVGWGFHPGQGQGQGGSMFWQRHGSERNSSHGHYRS